MPDGDGRPVDRKVDFCAEASRGAGRPTLRQNAAKRGSSL